MSDVIVGRGGQIIPVAEYPQGFAERLNDSIVAAVVASDAGEVRS